MEELHGLSRVGDIPWIRNREEVIYRRWLQIVTRRIRDRDIQTKSGSLDCITFDIAYGRVWFTRVKAWSYWSNELVLECRGSRQHGFM